MAATAAPPSPQREAAAETDATEGADRRWRSEAHIVIHADAADEQLSRIVAELLEDLGATDVERRTVESGTSDDQIRYFRAADTAMANALAGTLTPVLGRVRVRDFTTYEPSPASGLLELWLR